ncbi:DUF6171 family protein [Novosphingobium sp.]|uniref:DUF6171 family protein n=1 Tax=Novosphingobium sp. TaxID=1874826 RepID=UPI003458C80A
MSYRRLNQFLGLEAPVLAPAAMRAARLSVCRSCPQGRRVGKGIICRECGCLMHLKASLLRATCPLEKWDSTAQIELSPLWKRKGQ